MRPVLLLENVKTLHDARYCAAVGIGMLSFDLEPASPSSMSIAAAEEIAQWLMGVDCIAKCATTTSPIFESLALNKSFSHFQIPLDSYDSEIKHPLLLEIAGGAMDDLVLGKLLEIAESDPHALFLLPADATIHARLSEAPDVFRRCILRFDDPSDFFRQLTAAVPFGFSFGAFAFDVDGQLDYDACDRFIDSYNAIQTNESIVS